LVRNLNCGDAGQENRAALGILDQLSKYYAVQELADAVRKLGTEFRKSKMQPEPAAEPEPSAWANEMNTLHDAPGGEPEPAGETDSGNAEFELFEEAV
jgi:hypothetical protein